MSDGGALVAGYADYDDEFGHFLADISVLFCVLSFFCCCCCCVFWVMLSLGAEMRSR